MKVSLEEAVRILKQGGVVVYPTETCYGLGCNALKPKSIKKVYELKQRSADKPLSVLVPNKSVWRSISVVNKKAEALADLFWPGPLTILTLKKRIVPDVLTKETVACRVSSHPVAQKLCEECGFPITTTSANKSGSKNPYSPKQVLEELGDVPIIDVGVLPRVLPSTIVDATCEESNEVVVLRNGPISAEEIKTKLRQALKN